MKTDIYAPNIGSRLLAQENLQHHRTTVHRVRSQIDNQTPASFVYRQQQRLLKRNTTPTPVHPLNLHSRPSSRSSSRGEPQSRAQSAQSHSRPYSGNPTARQQRTVSFSSESPTAAPRAASPTAPQVPTWRDSKEFYDFVRFLGSLPMSPVELEKCINELRQRVLEEHMLAQYDGPDAFASDTIIDMYLEAEREFCGDQEEGPIQEEIVQDQPPQPAPANDSAKEQQPPAQQATSQPAPAA